MRTQQDHKVRAVSLANLEAMCNRASGMCHRFSVSKVSRSRVHVDYSNPDEYGHERPITAVFPCIPNDFEPENPIVLIGAMLRTIGGDGDPDYDYQQFDPIVSGSALYRSRTDWRTRQEISGDRYLCPDNVERTVDWNHSYTDDRMAAFNVTAEVKPPDYWDQIGARRVFVFFPWSDLTPVRAEVQS
jgi:hypothetical protein